MERWPVRSRVMVAALVALVAGSCAGSAASVAPSAVVETASPTPLDCPEPAPLPGAFTDDIVLVESTAGVDPNASRGTGTLCLDLSGAAPIAVALDCSWSADRRHVLGVTTLPSKLGDRDVGVALDGREDVSASVHLWTTTRDDRSASYRAVRGAYTVTATGTGADGRVDASMSIEPTIEGTIRAPFDGSDEGVPVSVALRWRCGAAPDPVPGVGLGRVVLRLDAPVARTFTSSATCAWSAVGDRPARVVSVSNGITRMPYRPDTFLQVAISVWGGAIPPALPPDVLISVTEASYERRSDYETGAEAIYWLDSGPDLGTGMVRFRGQPMNEAGDPQEARPLDGTDATRTLSGSVRWSCDAPAVEAAAEPPDDEVGPEIVDGRLTIEFEPPVAGLAFEGPATCELDRFGGDVYARRVRARLAGGDGVIVVDVTDRLRISRLDASGAFLGEYEGEVREYGSVRNGPFQTYVSGLAFIGDDPTFQPFDGGEGPVLTTGATVRYECAVPAEAP